MTQVRPGDTGEIHTEQPYTPLADRPTRIIRTRIEPPAGRPYVGKHRRRSLTDGFRRLTRRDGDAR